MELLAFLQKRDLELRIKFKSGNRLLTLNQEQIDTYDAKRRALIAKYPDLAAEAEVVEQDPRNPRWNLIDRKGPARRRQREDRDFRNPPEGDRRAVQHSRSPSARRSRKLDRRKQMEDAEYRSLEANLKNAKIDQTLDPSRMPNITVVQQPTEPIKTYDEKIKKMILGLAGGGLALGLGLAFLIELLFDRRVKRPIEIQTRLQLPLAAVHSLSSGGRSAEDCCSRHDQGVPRIGTGEDLALSNPESRGGGL